MDLMYTIGSFHGFIFFCTAIGILYSDHRGLNYFRGKEDILPSRFLKYSHRGIWIGLLLMISTGMFLAIPEWEYRLSQPQFFIKMGFVLLLVMNAVAIGKLSKKAGKIPFAQLTKKEKNILLISGALSVLGWVGAATIGLLFL